MPAPAVRAAWRRTLVLTACVTTLVVIAPAGASTASATDDAHAGTNGAAVPKLDWGACPTATPEEAAFLQDYECAVAKVPLSYDEPRETTIELALGRLPAADPAKKIGTLFWNPGGPGGSGRIPPIFSAALHERFDLVGFDPRGIAASTPLMCFDSNEQALSHFGLEFPITRRQAQKFIRQNTRGTQLCDHRGGPILEHMSTANVARDLDLLRQAVGDRQLTYLGFSYGTAIGEYYANLFPDKVRALTLDGVIDPTEWTSGEKEREDSVPVEFRLGSFLGTDQALNTFLGECVRDPRCAFAEPGTDLREKYDALLARLREAPVEVTVEGQPVVVTYQLAVYETLGALYNASDSTALAEGLQTLWTASEQTAGKRPAEAAPATGFQAPRALVARQGPDQYLGLEWLPAVQCTDSVNPSNPWLWPKYARLADELAAPFGAPWTFFSQPCATWPAEDPDRYTGPWDRPTANPILLIGNRKGDPATPYEDAVSTARELDDTRLLTFDSFGHTAHGGLSRCIDDAVDRYLIDQRLPPENLVCQPDLQPFDPLPEAVARRRQQLEKHMPRPPLPFVSNGLGVG